MDVLIHKKGMPSTILNTESQFYNDIRNGGLITHGEQEESQMSVKTKKILDDIAQQDQKESK